MKILILAGGSGTRLWPLSRKSFPKQFLTLEGGSSFLQKTVQRNLSIAEPKDLFIITNENYRHEVLRQVSAIPKQNILIEPEQKNTAPAILFALGQLAIREDEFILVCPADHLIAPQSRYKKHIIKAEKLAFEGNLVTFGVRPSKPETGYGYIKVTNGHVESFKEKPDLKTAREYLHAGYYFWNSGMFGFTLRLFNEEMKKHAPEFVGRTFEEMPALSIDYALMEKSKRVVMVPLEMTWSDVGSWENVYEFLDKDDAQNVTHGDVCVVDTSNSLILAEKRHVSTIGLRDIVVVETDDAVLVADRNSSQKVKELVTQLQHKGKKETEEHLTAMRPWGSYTVLLEVDGYKIKKIVVDPHQKLSLQQHQHRSEHWIVVKGSAKIRLGDAELELTAGESTFVPQETLHRLENPTNTPLEMIEVQVGTYLGEDDIVRFDDIYGRVETQIFSCQKN